VRPPEAQLVPDFDVGGFAKDFTGHLRTE
jgi:hypothetical protein